MPEYLAPGVYVEEVSYRSSSIQGVSTTTTGFIGPARSGPVWVQGGPLPPTPDVLTSLSDFEATFGDGQPLAFDDEAGSTQTNFLWHAARAFFTEGGQRLYVVRVYRANDPKTAFAKWPAVGQAAPGGSVDNLLTVLSRWPGGPGVAGQVQVSYTLTIGQNVLTTKGGAPAVGGLVDSDVVWIGRGHPTGTAGSATYRGDFYLAQSLLDPVSQQTTWEFQPTRRGSPLNPLRQLTGLVPPTSSRSPLDTYDEVRPVTLTVTFYPSDPTAPSQVWSGLALDPSHQRSGAADSVTALFALDPSNESLARTLPITIVPGANIEDGLDVLHALGLANSALNATTWNEGDKLARTYTFPLDGGSDGNAPKSGDYEGLEGTADDGRPFKTGLMAFEDIEEISIVAAPGSTFNFANKQDDVMETINLLIAHAQNMKYRIAVLDCGDKMAVADVLAMRGQLDSTYGAFYYPWVKIVDPITSNDLNLPPSGFVAGIYAAQRHQPIGEQGTGERGRDAGRRVRDAGQQGPAGGAQPRGGQLLPVLRGAGLPALGGPTDQLRSRVEVRQPEALLRLPRAVDRRRHAVRRLRAQRAALVDQHPADDLRLLVQRVPGRQPAGRLGRPGVLRPLRPHHDDPERPGQRPDGLPDRRVPGLPGRVRHLPDRPVDGQQHELTGPVNETDIRRNASPAPFPPDPRRPRWPSATVPTCSSTSW